MSNFIEHNGVFINLDEVQYFECIKTRDNYAIRFVFDHLTSSKNNSNYLDITYDDEKQSQAACSELIFKLGITADCYLLGDCLNFGKEKH